MQNRMNSEKAEALLKWVNAIRITSKAKSLQELASPKILMEIVCLIDKDYQVEDLPNEKCLAKVIKYLENFYHQPLADFLDQNKIIDLHDILEIGKISSLLLCCAVQGENVSECIDKITSLQEDVQFQLKIIIEGVLKDLDNGKIDSVNVSNILCQSESFRDVQGVSEEYQSSPIIMSPIPLYNSPIKALMASPQMQSRQSQLTISKLYKRLNQFQIKNNNLQRAHADLEEEIEEKRKQIEEQELKIQTLTKEATKVPVLEEEIESLSRFEIELDEVNRKYDRLARSTQELENYKEQFLRLEKDYSDLAAEKLTEQLGFEKRLSEVKSKNKEELQCVQSLLNDSVKTSEELRRSLQDASIAKETMEKQLSEQQILCEKETEKLKKALADSKVSRDKLCLKNDQDVLRQIAREAELKQCFRDQETTLQASIDHIQLQNSELKRNVEQLQISLNKELKTNTNLESSLSLSKSKLSDAICKYEHLQSDFISLGEESKNTMNKLLEEKNCLHEALKKKEADRDKENAQLLNVNEDLQEQSRCLVDELDGTKHKLLKTVKDKEEMQKRVDDFCKENKSLVEEKALLTKKMAEEERSGVKLKDSTAVYKTEIDVLLKENSVLKDDVKKLESLKRNVEALQSSLSSACKEKMSAIKDNAKMKERICMLEPLAVESTRLKDHVENVNEQLQTLKDENVLLNRQVKQGESLSKEMATLNGALRIAYEEKQSLQQKNDSLLNELAKIEMVSEEYKILKSRCEILEKERLFERKEKADMMKLKESLSSECANMCKDKLVLEERVIKLETQKQEQENDGLPEKMTDLRNLLRISEEEKHSLQKMNSSLKDELAKLETISTEYKVLQSRFEILNKEKFMVTKEKAEISNQCTNLRQLLDRASKDNLAFEETKDKLGKVLKENNLFKSDFAVANEQRLLIDKENTELKEKVKRTEDLSIECTSLHEALNESNKEKVSLAEENALLRDKLKYPEKLYNPSQNYTSSLSSEKSPQGELIPPMKARIDDSKVINGIIEIELRELVMSKLDEILAKVGCEQKKQRFAGEEGDITKIETELGECFARIVDHYSKQKHRRNDDKDCVEEQSIIKKYPRATPNEMNSNKEADQQTQELQNKILSLEKENKNLKEFQEKSKEEFLIERTKVEELEKNLRASEAAMETLNNNNVELELEVLSVQDQIKQLQQEKTKLKDYIPQVEAKVVNAENKLSEEEFISKRLAVEVRLLEAQLAHADRQLQRKVETEDSQLVLQKSHVTTSGKASVCKMPVVAEETPLVIEESTTEESSVVNDSIVSEFSMSEQKDVSVSSSQEHINTNTNMLCKNEECMDETSTGQQEEVLKRLRRRSAVYSKKNSHKSEINDKRRSTVGSESFVVGQFSNTVADEPDEHDYEWDRILELKKRNSLCARHLRSSYPVETQVCLKEEVEEEELKSGATTQSRKRLRENVSDSKIFTTLENSHGLPRSKSENTFAKVLADKISAKQNSLEANNKGAHLLRSSSSNEENVENIQQNNRRESIAFKVDITPAKKSRMSLRARMPRSFAAEKKETVRNKSKIKSAQATSRKLAQQKLSSVKVDKKQLKAKRSNFAI